MIWFLARRVVLGAVVLLLFSFVSFVLFYRLLPPPEPPVLHQYWEWLTGVKDGTSLLSWAHPDFFGTPPIKDSLGRTLALLGGAFVLVVVFSVLLAAAAARWQGGVVDVILRATSYVAWGVPAFLLAFVIQYVMQEKGSSRGLGPFPIAGWPGECPVGIGLNHGTITPCPPAGNGGAYWLHVGTHLFFPCISLALGFIGLHSRYLRSALLETFESQFITTARAKGLSERRVIFRHALRASLSTFVGILFADFGAIFGAAVGIDYVFELGGLGQRFVGSFHGESGSFLLYPLVALLLIIALFGMVMSLLSEIAVFASDPRTRKDR